MPSTVQLGTEQFEASLRRDAGIPGHAIQIEGQLIHIGHKNLNGWGITLDAADQIMAGIVGIPIRACSAQDPHECDFAFDNKSNIGYGVRSWIKGDWIMAAAAITDEIAVKQIASGTWMPFGHGNWSVAGIPTRADHFDATGFVQGYHPTGISLVFAPATPAFKGSGFGMVAAALTNYRGDNMTDINEAGGGDPATYTQAELDAKIASAIDAALAKQAADDKQHLTTELAQNKIDHDAQVGKLSEAEQTAFNQRLSEMTPTKDVDAMISAAMVKTKGETLEAIEREKLASSYCEIITASVVLGAPLMTFGQIDQMKVAAKMEQIKTLPAATIQGMITEAELQVAAASPAQSAFDANRMPGQAPGMNGDIELLADLNELSGRAG